VNNRTDPEIEQGSSLLPGQTTLNLRTARSRKSSEYGFTMHAGPLPSSQLEIMICPSLEIQNSIQSDRVMLYCALIGLFRPRAALSHVLERHFGAM
jgi:hypothetical protein